MARQNVVLCDYIGQLTPEVSVFDRFPIDGNDGLISTNYFNAYHVISIVNQESFDTLIVQCYFVLLELTYKRLRGRGRGRFKIRRPTDLGSYDLPTLLRRPTTSR